MLVHSTDCSHGLTIYWHWSLGHKYTEFTFFFDNSLLKEKILSKDHNGESKQWHERPAIVKSNLKLILVFVKHSPGKIQLIPARLEIQYIFTICYCHDIFMLPGPSNTF